MFLYSYIISMLFLTDMYCQSAVNPITDFEDF